MSQLPYKKEHTNNIYEMLFCDEFKLYKKYQATNKSYLETIFSDNPSEKELEKIIKNNDIESRIKILAYKKLSEKGYPSLIKDLLGIIIEVGLENGLDTLAAYKDGTARYINQSENIIIWESPNEEILSINKKMFEQGKEIIEKIGPWDKPRLTAPEQGYVRLTFLVADKIYFGQGPINTFFNDKLGGPLLQTATSLMQYLIKKSLENRAQ